VTFSILHDNFVELSYLNKVKIYPKSIKSYVITEL